MTEPDLAAEASTGTVGGNTMPVLIGYVRRALLVDDGEIDVVKDRLAKFAAAEGFLMGDTYVELPGGRWPVAFAAMMDAASRSEVGGVALPSLLHFAGLGITGNAKRLFEQTTGARVLVAEARP